jgi:hypothetical protein
VRIVYIDPPTATGESLVDAIVAAGLAGTYPTPATATAEDIVLALEAAGYIVGVLAAANATYEDICNALIAAGLMGASMTTWRADFVAAHVTILEAQSSATPLLLRKVYRTRPGSYNELPLAFVGGRPESLTHDAGTRTRTIAGEVWVVDSYAGDNQQDGDRMDELVDALVDRYDDPANVQRVGSSIIELTSVSDTDLEVTNAASGVTTFYRACVFTFGKSAKLEGRQ